MSTIFDSFITPYSVCERILKKIMSYLKIYSNLIFRQSDSLRKYDKSATAKARKETPAFGGIVCKSRDPKRAASIKLAALVKAKF